MSGLTVEQVEQFHTEGYLLVEDLFDPDQDIAPILNDMRACSIRWPTISMPKG